MYKQNETSNHGNVNLLDEVSIFGSSVADVGAMLL